MAQQPSNSNPSPSLVAPNIVFRCSTVSSPSSPTGVKSRAFLYPRPATYAAALEAAKQLFQPCVFRRRPYSLDRRYRTRRAAEEDIKVDVADENVKHKADEDAPMDPSSAEQRELTAEREHAPSPAATPPRLEDETPPPPEGGEVPPDNSPVTSPSRPPSKWTPPCERVFGAVAKAHELEEGTFTLLYEGERLPPRGTIESLELDPDDDEIEVDFFFTTYPSGLEFHSLVGGLFGEL
ncbi:hypothetical protein JCM10213_004765 [Rhodosporidiobolus nylandii]